MKQPSGIGESRPRLRGWHRLRSAVSHRSIPSRTETFMRLAKLMFALAVGLLVAGPAPAQPPAGGLGGGGFGGFGGGLANAIGRSKPLQDELKVDADQLEKLTAALTKAREETR